MAVGLAFLLAPPPASADTLFGSLVPETDAAPDTAAVELGVRFSTTVPGMITGVRFYKSTVNTGTHVGSFWNSAGQRLAQATFSGETASGWQSVTFTTPVAITPGSLYTASYFAPRGRYAATVGGFAAPYTSGRLTVPAGGGRYKYGGGYPVDNYLNINYFVDVMFTPSSTPSPTPTPTVPGETTLTLPPIPWEGGPAYWRNFPKANAAGWSSPTFFPIVVWFNGVSSNAEALYDKSIGINSYVGMWEGTPYSLFADNGIYWLGGKLNSSFNDTSKNWVGEFLDDEVDGRFPPAQGFAHLKALSDKVIGTGRFRYANFTQMVISSDMPPATAAQYVNPYTDAVSVDMYFYTIPYCDWRPYRDVYITPIDQAHCRTASSYGKTVRSLRMRDAADGKLQPMWQFVENLNGGPGEGPFVADITPAQLRAAVMNSVINEARGIVYFNQSFTGPCQGSAIFRQTQVNPSFCAAPQVDAARIVNSQIKALAPVINTQSYTYSFGSGLNTMLKAYNGSVYVFAMIDGSSSPGSRTFQLPAEVSGRTVTVLNENRTLTASSSGRFTDNFPAETTYHIYRIAK
ncbi:DUF4082 domain-containing protein [Actinopolymorpha rutila]|uniref:DUF4082 domain-containing protein n=1 Tax=Actinopolymorpha rutila TaxID=446787 RepID=A0A852ZG86_9ACTN|nr:hypothetical protein [Actinopolymorpha rutila]